MMSQTKRLFWLITTLAFLSGCSGYRLVIPPEETPTLDSEQVESPVKVGSKVKLKTITGEEVKGNVSQISNEGIFLKVGGDKPPKDDEPYHWRVPLNQRQGLGEDENLGREIAYSEISALYIKYYKVGATVGLVLLFVVTIGGIGVASTHPINNVDDWIIE